MKPGSHPLVLRRRNPARPGTWGVDDYDVLWNGREVGRVFYTTVVTPDQWAWVWTITACLLGKTISNGQGYEGDRQAAMRAFTAAWDRGDLAHYCDAYEDWLNAVRSI